MVRVYESGEEFITFEFAPDMSLRTNLLAIHVGRTLASEYTDGYYEFYPTNASMIVRFDADMHSQKEVVDLVLGAIADAESVDEHVLQTRLIAMPTWFDDPVTREFGERFAANRQDPDLDDLTYCARMNGFSSKEAFIEQYMSAPWIISIVGFYPGAHQAFQLAPRDKQIVVPKYQSPRTATAERTVAHGGCFTTIYPTLSGGGFQMLGRTATPVYQVEQTLPDFREAPGLFTAGDVFFYYPVDESEFTAIEQTVEDGTFCYTVADVEFSLKQFEAEPERYTTGLMGLVAV